MKLESELYETRYGGKGVYWNCESEVEHDAMAAHALLQAMDEAENRDEFTSLHLTVEWVNTRAAEILAGWMGEYRG